MNFDIAGENGNDSYCKLIHILYTVVRSTSQILSEGTCHMRQIQEKLLEKITSIDLLNKI